MPWEPKQILDILDAGCGAFTFPILDNGYVYLSATRMSLFRSDTDWAVVIEVFGFSPRAGLPDTHIHTFASTLHNRDKESDYVSPEAHRNYLANNPHNDSRFIHPITEESWLDEEEMELVNLDGELKLRDRAIELPTNAEFQQHGIDLEEDRPAVFELCRYLGDRYRSDVLGTESERRISVLPDMEQILLLDEWHHPNVVEEELPSEVESFQQLAEVLASGDAPRYSPSESPNTHWSNWPDGGTL